MLKILIKSPVSRKTAFVWRINRNQVASGNYGFLRNDRLKRKILSGNRFRAQTGARDHSESPPEKFTLKRAGSTGIVPVQYKPISLTPLSMASSNRENQLSDFCREEPV